MIEMNSYIPRPSSPAPLSNVNAYTTWPGGVDPTAALYNVNNQKGGRRKTRRRVRRSRKNTRSSRRNKK